MLTFFNPLQTPSEESCFKNRILIVEDEFRIAAFLQKGLRKNGFTTAVAEDGDQAISMTQESNFDLLLLDLGLPGKDGWTVLRQLRDQGNQLPIIIVTARNSERDRTTSLVAGANDYLTKPFRFAELLARVRAQLYDS